MRSSAVGVGGLDGHLVHVHCVVVVVRAVHPVAPRSRATSLKVSTPLLLMVEVERRHRCQPATRRYCSRPLRVHSPCTSLPEPVPFSGYSYRVLSGYVRPSFTSVTVMVTMMEALSPKESSAMTVTM